MPHAMGVEMAVVDPYHGEDKMLAAARHIVDEQMDHEDDNVYALAIDSNGVPAIRCLGHLIDERDGRDGWNGGVGGGLRPKAATAAPRSKETADNGQSEDDEDQDCECVRQGRRGRRPRDER